MGGASPLALLLLTSACCAALGADAPAADSEEEAQSCLLQHSQRTPEERAAATQRSAAGGTSPFQAGALTWYIIGFNEYTIDYWSANDWFSGSDVYAWVKVQPQGLTYKSRLIKDANEGNLDLHIYVSSNASSVEIDVWDKNTFSNVLLGSSSIDVSAGQTWCNLTTAASSGCTFSNKLKNSTQEAGTVKGYLGTGPFLRRRADKLLLRGVAVKYQDSTRTKSEFQQFRIRNDEVEHEMAYAKTGSVYPVGLHGIFWMDQRGTNVPIPEDPEYKQVCPVAADEILVSFGHGSWNAKKRCVTGVSVYGAGPFTSQWTWLDETGNGSDEWAGNKQSNAVYEFCFKDETDREIDIWTQSSINSLIKSISGHVPFKKDKAFGAPAWITNVRMIKTSWGWDRETTVGPEFLRKLIRKTLGGILGTAGFVGGGLACHYPLFQIVDGDGKRTKHYEAYLRYANKFSDCSFSTFNCPPNYGNGTSMTGRLVGP